ncbi:MAG: dihydrolipoyl dehydrogenase [Christensenella sp.]|nr:dihydrolipoyl dehydrogenase [Christensenella sp.]
MSEKFDVAVIGGGPAGYVSAIRAAMLGGKVVLFEKDTVGGTCLNRGCIPTKSYIRTAEVLEEIKNAGSRGIINNANASVDMEKVVAYKNGVVKKLTGGVAGLLRSHGVAVVSGEAVMTGKTTVLCGGKEYEAASTLLCGGSVPGTLPIPGVDLPGVLTSDGILGITEVPKTLCVIGGGVIGCEIATAFAAFGCEVTIVEYMPSLLPMLDEELAAAAKKSLEEAGIRILAGTAVSAVEETEGGLAVKTAQGDVQCEKVLLAVGRKPDLACLGSLAGQIKTQRGYVVVNDKMQTNIPNIYAPGDINGKCMLAHAAFQMGETAAENAMGKPEVCKLEFVPSCVYMLPELAGVGLTERQAAEQYGRESIRVGRFAFAANGRALAAGHRKGFVKVVTGAKYGELLGVHMEGAGVTEMIAEGMALMTSEVTAHEIVKMPHAHPTMSEAFMEACADALSQCVHLPKK